MGAMVPAAPPSGVDVFQGTYFLVTSTDMLVLVLIIISLFFLVMLIRNVAKLNWRVLDLEFQVAALQPEMIPNMPAPEPAPEPVPEPATDPEPAPAAPAGRSAKSPSRARPRPQAKPRTFVRPNIDLSNPHAVRNALWAVFGKEITLPSKRLDLLAMFEATFPAVTN